MKITIWGIPHEEHMRLHCTSKLIQHLKEENEKLKIENQKLKEKLKEYEFEEYVPDDLDIIELLYGYED